MSSNNQNNNNIVISFRSGYAGENWRLGSAYLNLRTEDGTGYINLESRITSGDLTNLLEEVEKECRQNGVHKLSLMTYETDKDVDAIPAIAKALEGLGFTVQEAPFLYMTKAI